jgi:hypothetical protein
MEMPERVLVPGVQRDPIRTGKAFICMILRISFGLLSAGKSLRMCLDSSK